MLIHPWDAPGDDAEWQDWLAAHDFGQLAVNGPPGEPPMLQPLHFAYDPPRREAVTHLARPNPLWAALEERPTVLLSVVDDYTFIPGPWQAEPEPAARARRPDQLLCRGPADLHRPCRGRPGGEGGAAATAAGPLPAGRRLGSGRRGRGPRTDGCSPASAACGSKCGRSARSSSTGASGARRSSTASRNASPNVTAPATRRPARTSSAAWPPLPTPPPPTPERPGGERRARAQARRGARRAGAAGTHGRPDVCRPAATADSRSRSRPHGRRRPARQPTAKQRSDGLRGARSGRQVVPGVRLGRGACRRHFRPHPHRLVSLRGNSCGRVRLRPAGDRVGRALLLRRRRRLRLGRLGDEGADQDHHAADDLRCGEMLAEQHPCQYGRDHRFQARHHPGDLR